MLCSAEYNNKPSKTRAGYRWLTHRVPCSIVSSDWFMLFSKNWPASQLRYRAIFTIQSYMNSLLDTLINPCKRTIHFNPITLPWPERIEWYACNVRCMKSWCHVVVCSCDLLQNQQSGIFLKTHLQKLFQVVHNCHDSAYAESFWAWPIDTSLCIISECNNCQVVIHDFRLSSYKLSCAMAEQIDS